MQKKEWKKTSEGIKNKKKSKKNQFKIAKMVDYKHHERLKEKTHKHLKELTDEFLCSTNTESIDQKLLKGDYNSKFKVELKNEKSKLKNILSGRKDKVTPQLELKERKIAKDVYTTSFKLGVMVSKAKNKVINNFNVLLGRTIYGPEKSRRLPTVIEQTETKVLDNPVAKKIDSKLKKANDLITKIESEFALSPAGELEAAKNEYNEALTVFKNSISLFHMDFKLQQYAGKLITKFDLQFPDASSPDLEVYDYRSRMEKGCFIRYTGRVHLASIEALLNTVNMSEDQVIKYLDHETIDDFSIDLSESCKESATNQASYLYEIIANYHHVMKNITTSFGELSDFEKNIRLKTFRNLKTLRHDIYNEIQYCKKQEENLQKELENLLSLRKKFLAKKKTCESIGSKKLDLEQHEKLIAQAIKHKESLIKLRKQIEDVGNPDVMLRKYFTLKENQKAAENDKQEYLRMVKKHNKKTKKPYNKIEENDDTQDGKSLQGKWFKENAKELKEIKEKIQSIKASLLNYHAIELNSKK